jgi:hypothetical protein
MAIKYSKGSKNITTFSIPRPSKFYPNWEFLVWKQSGNPAQNCLVISIDGLEMLSASIAELDRMFS